MSIGVIGTAGIGSGYAVRAAAGGYAVSFRAIISCIPLFLAAHILLACFDASAAEQERPAFRMFRWEEDYRSLERHARAGLDTIKYVPLSSSMWLSLGGEARVRIEHASRPALGVLGSGDDTYTLQRALVHGDLHLGDRFRLFVELGAFDATNKQIDAPPSVDQLDVQQAFVDLRIRERRDNTVVRLGRQEMAFGSQRLIGIRDGPNVRRNYDGLRITRTSGLRQLDLIAVRPVELESGVFDNKTSNREVLVGVYATDRTSTDRRLIDIYALGYEREEAVFANASGREKRVSLGSRFFGSESVWDWDIEATVQTGTIARSTIFAWGLASNVGYRRSIGDVSVRAGVKVDYASGDDKPDDQRLGTANAMFPRLPYLGSAGAFAPSNLIDVHPHVELAFPQAFSVTFGYQLLWRASTSDAVYVAPLIAFPASSKPSGRRTAQQVSVDLSWRANRHFAVDASLAHVQVTKTWRERGAGDVSFAFVAGTYRF
ncbi:alginate export family protein [Povalibacter sp.]|uniref:alginate export family protein n=1 Tax=Povalibacter sp. TaxID=1962978 RepID=UPI002F4094DB